MISTLDNRKCPGILDTVASSEEIIDSRWASLQSLKKQLPE
jgi:uncharacterized protein